MSLKLKKSAMHWQQSIDLMWSPISPKNLRLAAILIAIYQMLIAHLFLFFVLLGFAHVEELKNMLAMDIEDQKNNGYYYISPFSNQVRFHSATELVSYTETLLYICTVIATVYALSTILLTIGVFKNRWEMMLPYLILEIKLIVAGVASTILLSNNSFIKEHFGILCYLTICILFLFANALKWYIIFVYYQSVRTINKLREIATVAIPMPPPGTTTFQYQGENMYLGSKGYKHILTESPDGPY